jgi:copper(I)-binding protein
MKTLLVAVSLALLQPSTTATDASAVVSGGAAAVVATLNNPSMYDVYIVSGKSDIAETIELMDGDKKVESFTVPAYGSFEMQPAKRRIRVSGLKRQLKAGEELTLTLETDGGASIAVTAVVKSTDQ